MDKLLSAEEGDALIAVFDGYWEVTDHPEYDRWFTRHPIKHFSGYAIHELKYHSSWDWLMGVYLKYREVMQSNDMKWHEEKQVFWQKIKAGIAIALQLGNREKLWERLVDFIQWYNNQQ